MLFVYVLAISIVLTGTLLGTVIYSIPQWDDPARGSHHIRTLTIVWILSLLACVAVVALNGFPLGPM